MTVYNEFYIGAKVSTVLGHGVIVAIRVQGDRGAVVFTVQIGGFEDIFGLGEIELY